MRGWFLASNSVLWCGCQSLVTESFANLKAVKTGLFCVFFFSPTYVLRLGSSLAAARLTTAF
ncbi:hypothetical protein FORC22_1944 [Vibrio parahaemolyticus]|nr:hypothetical protein FORC22_1944 [Vibrio parahaemolyticus]